MTGNVIDSFFVALGFKVDPKGIDELRGKVDGARESLLSWGGALTGLISGLALHKVAEIGSQFEQNRIQIAGFLSALGLSSDFNAGLHDASDIIQKITTDAAKLPGEAEEYVEVFKANAAFLKNGLPGANANQIADFTNKLTAVAKTVASSLDASQIARESSQLLAVQGRAGGHNVLWQKLMPFLMQLDGQAKITAQSFNAMTQPKRVELLQAAFAKLQPMLDASADSFDAMWGAFVSGAKQITRIGTGGLFETIKKQIQSFTSTFIDDNGKLTARGQDVVNILGKISRVVGTLMRDGVQLTIWFLDLSKNSALFKVVLVALAGLLAGAVWESFAGKLAKFAKGLKASTMLTGLLWIALGLVVEDIWGFFHGADSVTGILVEKLGPGIWLVAGAVGALATAFIALKVQAIAAAIGVNASFLPVWGVIALIGLLIFAGYELQRHWKEVGKFFEDMFNPWIDRLNTVLDLINKVAKAMGIQSNLHVDHVGKVYTEEPEALKGFHSGPYRRDAMDVESWLHPGAARPDTPGSSTVKHGDVNIHGGVNITAPGGKEAAQEFMHTVRTAQSGRVR